MSNIVQDQDAEAAIDILKFALFKEAPKKKSRSKRARLDRPFGDSGSDESDDDDEQDDGRRQPTNGQRRSSRVSLSAAAKGKIPVRGTLEEDMEMMEIDVENEVEEELIATRRASRRSQASSINNIPSQGSSTGNRSSARYVPGGDIHPSRQALFQSRANTAIMSSEDDSLSFEELLAAINRGLELDELFGPGEATAILNKMNDANKLMFSEGIIYKI